MTSENVESLKNAPRKPSAVNDAADDDFPAPPSPRRAAADAALRRRPVGRARLAHRVTARTTRKTTTTI